MNQNIGIIGGGAAGIMVAATLLEENTSLKVDLFEKNDRLGVKVSISGGGRCNVTTGITDINLLLSKYIRGSKFLSSSMKAFPPNKVFEWFEKHGVPLKIEKDMRVFPSSDNGADVVAAFLKIFEKHSSRINIKYLESVIQIEENDNKKFEVITKKGKYMYDKLVLTTGGNAYRHTGSSGDGYDFAKRFGHSITSLGPSLNSFEVLEEWCKDLKGVSFQKARIEIVLSDASKESILGPVLLTHFGMSGPGVFAMAAHVAFEEIKRDKPLKVSLIPDSDLNFENLDKKLSTLLNENGGKFVINVVSELVPYKFAEKILELCKIEGDKKSAEISRQERQSIVHLLTGKLQLTLIARRQGDEFVTAGGINLDEVDSKSLKSKLNQNLYFAGEILNIDGLTGGFNLQAAWATGRSAGLGIIRSLG